MALNKNAKKWVKALRSRKYKQTTGRLGKDNKFCCLGVACEVAMREGVISSYDQSHGGLPPAVTNWLGLTTRYGGFAVGKFQDNSDLTVLNDSGKRFATIAKVIESQPEGLFAEK